MWSTEKLLCSFHSTWHWQVLLLWPETEFTLALGGAPKPGSCRVLGLSSGGKHWLGLIVTICKRAAFKKKSSLSDSWVSGVLLLEGTRGCPKTQAEFEDAAQCWVSVAVVFGRLGWIGARGVSVHSLGRMWELHLRWGPSLYSEICLSLDEENGDICKK